MTADPEEAYRLIIPLPEAFRFTHEPLEQGATHHFVGRENQIELLLDRITWSRGGAFLITGYRGVGKTSFVNQLLGAFERGNTASRVVAIHLNLARPVTPVELMFLIIRCLYLQLTECGLSREIVPEVMNDLRLAYDRTLMTIKQTRSAGSEFSLTAPEVDATIAGAKTKFSPLFGYKRTGSQGNETSYLTYEERAAESDVIRLSRRLRDSWLGPRSWWSRKLRRPARPIGDLRIVFVFDELDKIEEPAVLDGLFSALKNVFTTSGLTFLFVAGKDVQERWEQEIGRGESIYESVFAYEMYLPCLWTQARQLCAWDRRTFENPPPDLEAIWRALSFHGRGIPRRILRNFHTLIRWRDRQPVLAVTAYEFRDAEFFAGLERVLEEIRTRTHDLDRSSDSHPDADKRALGLYYLVDWILQRGTREFTLADAIAAYEALNVKLVFSGAMAGQIEALLSALLASGYIENTDRIEEKQFVRKSEATARHYRLTRTARPSAAPEEEAGTPARFADYLPLDPIATGGISRVVRAVDSRSNEIVALKYVRGPSPQVRAVFTAEADAMGEIAHHSIPAFRAAELDGDVIWIAMDFIDAPSLDRILARRQKLSEPAAISAALGIAHVCRDLHKLGYVHGDLKPSNVLVNRTGGISLIDFSTARRADAPIPPYGVIGTPAYMAPELLRGEPSSVATDVYAVGVLLYELVCGRRPYLAETREELLDRITKQAFRRPSALGPVSPAAEEAILYCLKADLSARPPDMAALVRLFSSLHPSNEALAADVGMVDAAAAKSTDVITQVEWAPPNSAPKTVIPPPGTSPGMPTVLPRATAMAFGGPPRVPRPDSPPRVPHPDFPDAPVLRDMGRNDGSTPVDYPLRGVRNRIGRSPDSEICIPDSSFSRLHAIISLEGGEYRLMDAGSLNSTMINGVRLPSRESVTLKPGDRIEIGGRVLIFQPVT
jgi:serine/threonine-protein kinase